MRNVTIGGRLDAAHPAAAPHAAAFEVYRHALIAGKLPTTIARDRVAGRTVRDWGAAWASPPVPDQVVDVGLALLDLEDGRFDVLEFTTRPPDPQRAPHHRHGRFEAAGLVAAPGWTAAWSYQQHRTARHDHRPATVEHVVVAMHRHPDLWRLTRHHAADLPAAPAFVAGPVPPVTSSPSPRVFGRATDTFRRLVRVPDENTGWCCTRRS